MRAQLNIASGVRESARAAPSRVAVVDEGRELTYAAVEERSRRFARHLLGKGLTTGDRVAILLGNRLEYVEIAAGLARVGLIGVPLNPRQTAHEVAHIVAHSGARALVHDDAYASIVGPVVDDVCFADVLSIGGTSLGPDYEGALEAVGAGSDPFIAVDESEPFVIAYTSGTTGTPKGVVISHRSRVLLAHAAAIEYELGRRRPTVAVAPMYHGAGFVFGYGSTFSAGTTWMLRSFDPERLLGMLERSRATSVFLVPTHAQVLRELGDDVISRFDLACLTTAYFNAAALPVDLKRWFIDAFPSAGVHELYGSTEAAVVTSLPPEDALRKAGTVGPPFLMNEVRIVDDDGAPLGAGGTGELFSRSPYLMNGYWNDPEATAACTSEDGFVSAGDIARLDEDGCYTIVDRKKDLIISGGTNVYPREVEDVIRTFPGVADVAVVGLPSDRWGEQVAAAVVATRGAQPDTGELEAACRRVLSAYKVPRQWTLVDALPRNAAGKVLKRVIVDTWSSGTS